MSCVADLPAPLLPDGFPFSTGCRVLCVTRCGCETAPLSASPGFRAAGPGASLSSLQQSLPLLLPGCQPENTGAEILPQPVTQIPGRGTPTWAAGVTSWRAPCLVRQARAWGPLGAPAHRSSLCPREGYNNPPVSGENLIGLSRARRPHNAIFVNFEEDEVPTQPLEAAVQTWRKISTNPMDRKVEEELRKVSSGLASALTTSRLPTWALPSFCPWLY